MMACHVWLQHASRHGYAVEDLVTKLETSSSKRNLLLINACRSQVHFSPNPDLLQALRVRALASFEQQLATAAANDTLDEEGISRAPEWAVEREHDRLQHGLRDNRSTIVCYACRNLGTASDGRQGENGVYTAALLQVSLLDNSSPPVAFECTGALLFSASCRCNVAPGGRLKFALLLLVVCSTCLTCGTPTCSVLCVRPTRKQTGRAGASRSRWLRCQRQTHLSTSSCHDPQLHSYCGATGEQGVRANFDLTGSKWSLRV